jgi:hypothetical protein
MNPNVETSCAEGKVGYPTAYWENEAHRRGPETGDVTTLHTDKVEDLYPPRECGEAMATYIARTCSRQWDEVNSVDTRLGMQGVDSARQIESEKGGPTLKREQS